MYRYDTAYNTLCIIPLCRALMQFSTHETPTDNLCSSGQPYRQIWTISPVLWTTEMFQDPFRLKYVRKYVAARQVRVRHVLNLLKIHWQRLLTLLSPVNNGNRAAVFTAPNSTYVGHSNSGTYINLPGIRTMGVYILCWMLLPYATTNFLLLARCQLRVKNQKSRFEQWGHVRR